MKYKHYSPKSKVYLVKAGNEKYAEFLNSKKDENILALCFEEDTAFLKVPFISYGASNDYFKQAKNLFSSLRKADKLNPKVIYAHCCEAKGVGIAVYNRLIRSAGFDVIEL